MGYAFGVKTNWDNKLIVSTAKIKEKIDKDLNNTKTNHLLKNAMDYYRYLKFSKIGEFVSEDCAKNKEDIIKELSKCPLLKYDKVFENFASTYLWCFGKISGYEIGEIIYVVPKLLWNHHIYRDFQYTDIKVSEFLESLNFHEQEEEINKFILDADFIFNAEIVKKNLNGFEYLEYSEEFEKIANDNWD